MEFRFAIKTRISTKYEYIHYQKHKTVSFHQSELEKNTEKKCQPNNLSYKPNIKTSKKVQNTHKILLDNIKTCRKNA